MTGKEVLVLVQRTTPRLEYIFDFFSEAYGLLKFMPVTDRDLFLRSEGFKLDYSGTNHGDIGIDPHPILWEEGVRPQSFDAAFFRELPFLSRLLAQAGTERDIIGFSFFLLSRYEEYLPTKHDVHGRFSHSESVLYQWKLLPFPVVDHMAVLLFRLFLPEETIASHLAQTYRFINTLDLDQLYAYRYKTVIRNLGGAWKDLLKGRFHAVLKRWKTVRGKATDPFDTHEWIMALQQKYGFTQKVFFLSGGRTAFDPHLDISVPELGKLIRYYTSAGEIGLHPSYDTAANRDMLLAEKKLLEHVSGAIIKASRQHYLRVQLPHTYRILPEAGIVEDYSMGYAEETGFRAGTAHSFYWYDLLRESAAPLRIFPVTCMEGTYMDALGMEPAAALDSMKALIEQCRKYGGCFIPLFHNHTISKDFAGGKWREVYVSLLSEALENREGYA